MAKYIDCEAAYRFAQDQLKKETGAYTKGWNNALGVMKGALHNNDAIPAADVVPVVRGKWIDEPIYKQTLDGKTYDGYTYCSNCKADYPFGHKAYFCEVCGADMREVEQHD